MRWAEDNEPGIESLLDELGLPRMLERAARWVERHPRTVLTGLLVASALVFTLVQSPAETVEQDLPAEDTPLFI